MTIQSRSESDDGGGGVTITYADSVTVRAAIEPGNGREFMAAQQLMPSLTHMVTIRYRSGITTKYRFKYVTSTATRTFAIHSITDPLERHEQLVCFCEEEPAA